MNMRKCAFPLLIILTITVISVFGKAISSREKVEEVPKELLANRILNGSAATLGQFPQQVALCKLKEKQKTIFQYCGGSIVSSTWIVTAAHCLLDPETFKSVKVNDMLILAGVLTLKYQIPEIQVKRYVIHPDYKMLSTHHDIALIEMDKPFDFSGNIRPVELIKRPVDPGTMCQVSGWGITGKGKPVRNQTLQFTSLPIIDNNTCQEWLKAYDVELKEGQICAGYEEGQQDSCMFDSGGGLLCDGALTGIVSAGVNGECGVPRTPGIYTDVYYYRSWINSYIHPNSASEQSKRHFLSVSDK